MKSQKNKDIIENTLETELETVEEESSIHFPEHRILLWNDETSDFEMVMSLLVVVFSYNELEAFEITKLIHENTNATVWTGTYEVGELRLEQCQNFISENKEFLKDLKVTLEEV
jgi:ATP-dependent Clp protease adaptor protein ClpS